MEMAFCPQCGTNVADGTATCPQCGASIAPAFDPNQVQPQQQMNPPYQQGQPYGQPYMPYPAVDPKDHTAEFDAKDISDNKVFAMIAYVLGVVGVVIALLAAQKSDYAMFHTRQSLKITICETLLIVLMIIPFLGWIVMGVCAMILLVVRIIMFFQVCKGQAKDAPIVGGFGFLK